MNTLFKWILVLLILITTFVMFRVDPSKYMNQGDMYTFSELIENVAGAGVVAFLTWRFLFKKKKTSGMYTFATLLLVLNLTRIFWPDHESAEQKGWVIFHQQLFDVQNGKHITSKTFSEKDYGVVAKYLNVENQQLVDVQSLNDQLNQDIKEHSLDDLTEDADNFYWILAGNQLKLQYLKDRSERYKVDEEELWNKGLDEKVDAANLTDQEKQGFYNAMNPMRKANIKALEAQYNYETDFFKVVEQFFDFLGSTQEHFDIENHQIVFHSQVGKEQFDRYMKKMDMITKDMKLGFYIHEPS